MTDTHGTRAGDVGVGAGPTTAIDWIAAERSPEFRELVKRRNAFVIPATIFAAVWYFGFIILAGYDVAFMNESVYQGFTVGYLIALTNFVMVWGLGWLYLRKADRVFDPLAEKAAQTALEAGRRAAGGPTASERPGGGEVRP